MRVTADDSRGDSYADSEIPAVPKNRPQQAGTAWRDKFQANIVDPGGRLKPGGKILSTSGVTDGPYAEAKEVVGYDRAVEIARACPGVVRPGASVEIREIATQ